MGHQIPGKRLVSTMIETISRDTEAVRRCGAIIGIQFGKENFQDELTN